MKLDFSAACVAVLVGYFHFSAMAQTTPSEAPMPATAASAPAAEIASPAESTVPVAAAAAIKTNELPKLVMHWDCGDCVPNEKVFPLIEAEYLKAALASGRSVSAAETAELTIVGYRQRPTAARVMLGFLAGKDLLKAKIIFRGKEYLAEDYSANAMYGMNSLCEAVAKQAAKQLASATQTK